MDNLQKYIEIIDYDGIEKYSDGDIEKELLDIVKENSNYEHILMNDNRWPLLYHLSKERQNAFSWIPFNSESNLLEIGSGCGAITELFCEKLKEVHCVELSKIRSEINYFRNKRFDNFKIFVSSIENFSLDVKYDYVTLIGVLEYSGLYIKSENPYVRMLELCRDKLSEDGELIIAIENKFGIKYFSGSREDHTGNYFDSVVNYNGKTFVNTFSKFELTNMLKEVGFSNIEFYYPYPDYKFASVIFSDDRLPYSGEVNYGFNNYDQDRVVLFNELLALNNIIESNLFDIFSNSYIVKAKINK